jgi:uncharacterized coiled-coil protein SlyX
VPPPAWLRRLRQHFGISAPRMTVRTHLAWPWRAVIVAAVCLAIAGMWWWGFDFGRLPGGLGKRDTAATVAALEADAARLHDESAQLRARSSRLESELAMRAGALQTLTKQVAELQSENAQLREELAFLQKLLADANKQVGLSIQRLAVERIRDDLYRYSMLIVRGGNPAADFEGSLALQVTVQPAASGGGLAPPIVLSLPDDEPALAGPLHLKFKYYQRVEGTFHVPPGALVRALTARAFEDGHPNPRTTRSLNVS